jgi:hypothetical protein
MALSASLSGSFGDLDALAAVDLAAKSLRAEHVL